MVIKSLLPNKKGYRKLFLALLVPVIFSQLACGTFQVIILTPVGEKPIHTPVHPVITSTSETPGSSLTDTPPKPTNTPASKDPAFSQVIFFSYEPDAKTAQRVFPMGTKQIFAIWQYSHMREGSLVRRIWYRNSEVWFYQEEPWDYNRYGSDGSIEDVTVYDFEKGLKPGIYWLRLYIDGVEQTSPQDNDDSSFKIIDSPIPEPVFSIDGNRTLFLPDPRTLAILYPDREQRLISNSKEVASMAWFPDNRHVIMSLRDRSRQDFSATPFGIRDEFWIIDTDTGLRIRISTPDENFHMPSVSPDGRYIVAISGTGQYEACKADLSVSVIEVDQNFSRVSIQNLVDFTGVPKEKYHPFPYNHPAVALPGKWLDNNHISVAIKFPCTSGNNDGIFIFDLLARNAEKAP